MVLFIMTVHLIAIAEGSLSNMGKSPDCSPKFQTYHCLVFSTIVWTSMEKGLSKEVFLLQAFKPKVFKPTLCHQCRDLDSTSYKGYLQNLRQEVLMLWLMVHNQKVKIKVLSLSKSLTKCIFSRFQTVLLEVKLLQY